MTNIPQDFQKALNNNSSAKGKWQGLTPISQRDFIRWITSAKQLKTREGRINKAISKLNAGQKRPCCYAVVPMNLYKELNLNVDAKATWKGLTPDERRDLVDWIESENAAADKLDRTNKTIKLLAKGKKKV